MKLSQKPEQYQVCQFCGYPFNQSGATHCEACKLSLKRQTLTQVIANIPTLLSKYRSHIAAKVLLFALLSASGIYWFWKSQSNHYNHYSFVTSSKQTSGFSNLQITYNLMQEIPNVPSGLFSYGGSPAFAPLHSQKIIKAIAIAHPNFHLRYSAPLNNQPGSGAGIAMLMDGELAFAESSRPLTDAEYSKAKLRNFELKQIPIALDGIVFFSNPKLSLPGLSVDQIQAILTGKVKNWQQVGGPNLPVILFTLDPKVGGSTLSILLKDLPNQKLSSNLRIAKDYTDAIRKVAITPGSIGYGSSATVNGQGTIRPLAIAKANTRQYISPFISGRINAKAFQTGTYPLTRYQFVVVRCDQQLAQYAGFAYANLMLSNQGQQLIKEAGFVPLRN